MFIISSFINIGIIFPSSGTKLSINDNDDKFDICFSLITLMYFDISHSFINGFFIDNISLFILLVINDCFIIGFL